MSPKLHRTYPSTVAQRTRWQPGTKRTGIVAGKGEPTARSVLRGLCLTPAKPTRLPEILPHHRALLGAGGDQGSKSLLKTRAACGMLSGCLRCLHDSGKHVP